MEQNLVSDEELIERINKVLNDSKEETRKQVAETWQENALGENFKDVYESVDRKTGDSNNNNNNNNNINNQVCGLQKNLLLENHYLSLQLEAEKKKSKELQSKFILFENSVKYFERLNGQLETIKRTVDEECLDSERGDLELNYSSDTMQKIRPKTIHTAPNGNISGSQQCDTVNVGPDFSEPREEESGGKQKGKDDKEEVVFRDAEDFKQLEQGLEIVKDKNSEADFEAEKVFITKTEKRCLEDIGNLASRTRTPLDDKHQKFFERDRRRFANSIVMPEVQEVDKSEPVPAEIISKTKETPVNITSTELDGLRSYLLQLKELIARRETAWARTTERDYNQRVEITRFKNEVSHLRMLCEKRQRDIKERDQIIASKDEEIRELQKRVQGLRNALMKLEKKDDKFMDTIDGMAHEVLENSHIIQRSYNAMKRQSVLNRVNTNNIISTTAIKQPANVTQVKPSSTSRDSMVRKPKVTVEKGSLKKVKGSESTSNDEEIRTYGERTKQRLSSKERSKARHRSESLVTKTKETFDKVDEKLQRVEEMLHNEVLKGTKKSQAQQRTGKNSIKNLIKNSTEKADFPPTPNMKKLTPSNSTIRQEMLTAMTGLKTNSNLGIKNPSFPDPKRNQGTAAVIANALLAARNANLFNY